MALITAGKLPIFPKETNPTTLPQLFPYFLLSHRLSPDGPPIRRIIYVARFFKIFQAFYTKAGSKNHLLIDCRHQLAQAFNASAIYLQH